MFIISGEKGTGKTKALIERAKSEDGIIVCENTVEMRERAYAYGVTGLNLISYDDFYDCKVACYDKPIYIHDINKFIKYQYNEIKGYTLNLD